MIVLRTPHHPLGVKISPSPDGDYPRSDTFSGVSYCQAVHRASEGPGRALSILPGSIETCAWSRQVFGFDPAGGGADLHVEYHLPSGTDRLLLAPVGEFRPDHPPDVVLVRTTADQLRALVEELGWDRFATHLAGSIDRSALGLLQPGATPHRRVRLVNEALANLNRTQAWRDLTRQLFKSARATAALDAVLKRYLANMSICRNSTVIPFLTGLANVSYFCTGGIAWGENLPKNMTCGMPFEMYRQLEIRRLP